MGSRLAVAFEDYEAYHRTSGNKLCHYVGIPVIAFTLVGLLSSISVGTTGPWSLDLAVVVVAAVVLYDFLLSPRLALSFAIVLVLFYYLARPLPSFVLWAGFLLGWALQFLGHYAYEGKSPAFFNNLRHLMTGPLWVLARIVREPAADRVSSGEEVS